MEALIPAEWFVGRPWWLLLLVATGALLVLMKGADWLVEAASDLAYRAGISKVIVGATVVSLGTTSPECAVSVMAAWEGNAGLALGNAVGSIIADTALIFGLGAVLTQLPADRFILRRQGWVQVGSGVLLAVLCYGAFVLQGDAARLPRLAGLLLLALLVAYLVVSVRWSRQHGGEAMGVDEEAVEQGAPVTGVGGGPHVEHAVPVIVMWGLLGLALVITSSHVLILSVEQIAMQWGVPQVVLAATLVAVGTSLPELVVGMTSIRRGHPEILVGNIIGADVLNVLFVVGASAVASPLPVVERLAAAPGEAEQISRVFLYLHLPTMLVVLLLFRLFILDAMRRGRFHRWFGWPLLAIYATYVVVQFAVS